MTKNRATVARKKVERVEEYWTFLIETFLEVCKRGVCGVSKMGLRKGGKRSMGGTKKKKSD